MNIIQVNTHDKAGGAAAVARQLFQQIRSAGHTSRYAVGIKLTDDEDIYDINTLSHLKNIQNNKLKNISRLLSRPGTILRRARGIEDFDYPDSRKLLDLPGGHPDIIHAHNLHGGYFDLRFLTELSCKVPLVLTLHDAWLLSGHCAHSFDCCRWKTGCGQCPDLSIYPPVMADNTAYNWNRKRKIFSESRMYVSTPSRWLMDKVDNSILAQSIIEKKVIPCGIDLNIFKAGNKEIAREKLGLPQENKILLFTSNGICKNEFKDYKLLREVIRRIATSPGYNNIKLVALGESDTTGEVEDLNIYFVPKQEDPEIVAKYYQASDIYVHASKVDTFPLVILEAMACGLPVIATSVGGIPEQVIPLDQTDIIDTGEYNDIEDATGILVEQGNIDAMENAIKKLINNGDLCKRLGKNGAVCAKKYYDLNQYTDVYLDWYRRIISRKKTGNQ